MSVYARQEEEQPVRPAEPARLARPTRPTEAGWPSPPDPGDLSKRIARRRTELRLSTAQVAARATISVRYVEYLERYPAAPAGLAAPALAVRRRS